MAKTLFYSGIIFCALLAASSISSLVNQTELEGILVTSAEGTFQGGLRLMFVLVMSVSIAALFIRMASLVAARNLFAALFATFSVACAAVALGSLAALQLRAIMISEEKSLASDASGGLQVTALYVFGWFLSLALFALRPYFRIQASRTLSLLVSLPLPVFAWYLLSRLQGVPGVFLTSRAAASLTYWALIAALFLAISIHCLRHRHLFIEVTNLRELLDRRIDPADTPRRRITFSGGGVAFDS